jgi:carboxylesterase
MARTRYADWRAEVEATVARLRAAAERVFLVGLSMGGTLSVDVAASAEPPLAGLVTINAQILSREGALVRIAPLIERVVPFVPASMAGLRKNDIAKPGVSEHAYDWVSPAAGNSFLRELGRVREQAARLLTPVLIAYSRDDHSVPPDNSRALLDLVKSEDKTELVLLRSYHVATLDYDLELLEERIAAFCDRLGGIAAED